MTTRMRALWLVLTATLLVVLVGLLVWLSKRPPLRDVPNGSARPVTPDARPLRAANLSIELAT